MVTLVPFKHNAKKQFFSLSLKASNITENLSLLAIPCSRATSRCPP